MVKESKTNKMTKFSNKKKEINYNRSIIKGINVLKCFSNENPELSISEISKMCDMTQSTTYRIMVTLTKEHLLNKNNQSGNYRLGLAHLSLANQVISYDQMSQVARSELPRLAEETGCNANMARIFNEKAIYICRMDSPHNRYSRAMLGREIPLYCTGLGKALLMDMSIEEIEDLIGKGPFKKYTKTTILSTKSLYTEIKKSLEDGYIFDNAEMNPAAACFAAPIRGKNNEIIASISISTEKLGFNKKNKDRFIQSLLYSAKMLSTALGHQASFV